ncbi:MAG: hypothetical protein PHW10_00795 [Candidatus Peribacteraceae bacterium]|nr:hypothetical protein [Candidatus Peribacteraceae bacterium]
MFIITSFLSALIPTAFAAYTDSLGEGKPGISEMWETISSLFPSYSGSGGGALDVLFTRAQGIVMIAIATVAVGSIAFAALQMISSGVTEESAGKAKTTLRNAIIGVLLAIMADGIILFVYDILMDVAG